MTLLLVVLALTWSGLATWTYFDNCHRAPRRDAAIRSCRCERQLPPKK